MGKSRVSAAWSAIGKRPSADAVRVEVALEKMRRADHVAADEVAKARAEVTANSVSSAKLLVVSAAALVSDALACSDTSASSRLRCLPLYFDESSPFTRAHRIAEAHDAESARLLQVRSALYRATIGDQVQVTAALAAVAEFWSTPNPCGCTESPEKPVRVVTEASVSEPLLAVSESEAVMAYGSGVVAVGADGRGGPPVAFAFDRLRVRSDGSHAMVSEAERDVPADVVDAWVRGEGCVPWVRVERDPKAFAACARAAKSFGHIENADSVYRILRSYMAKQDQEVFLVLGLDVQAQVRSLAEIARGQRDGTGVLVPETLRIPLIYGCSSVIVAHNHPSGVTKPSAADDKMTRALRDAFAAVGITMLDHVIVGHSGFYSYRDKGKMD